MLGRYNYAADASANRLLEMVLVAATVLGGFPSKSLANALAINTRLRAWVHNHVTHITFTLALDMNDVSSWLATLVKGSWPNLLSVNLDSAYLLRASVKTLSQGDWPLLTTLNLRNSCIGPDAVHLLVQAPWPNLKHLNLSHNHIGNKGLAELCKAKWPLLESLVLRDSKNWAFAAHQLIKGDWPLLRTLNLQGEYMMSPSNIAELVKADWPLLERLQLHVDGRCNTQACMELVTGQWPRLQLLHVSSSSPSVYTPLSQPVFGPYLCDGQALRSKWPLADIRLW